MRFKLLSLMMLLSVATLVVADDEGTLIPSTDKAALAAAEGKMVSVTGKVSSAEWSKSGKVMNIEFDNDTTFIAAVFAKNRQKLDAAFNGDLAKTLTGATVKISGKLAKYGGRAEKYADASQLIISMPTQITIVTPATQPTTAPAAEPTTEPAGVM
ncbi:MAG: hypothetical protein ACTHLN_13060 [Tepidisphaeraceae bacterium]